MARTATRQCRDHRACVRSRWCDRRAWRRWRRVDRRDTGAGSWPLGVESGSASSRVRVGRSALRSSRTSSDRRSQFDRAARASPFRTASAGLAWRRRHQHAVVRDLVDAPRRRTAGRFRRRTSNTILVRRRRGPCSCRRRSEDAERAAIGNRAGVGNRHFNAWRAITVPTRSTMRFELRATRPTDVRQHVEDPVEVKGQPANGAADRIAWTAPRRSSDPSASWRRSAGRARRADCGVA